MKKILILFLLHFSISTSTNGVLSENINIYSNQNTVNVNIGNQTQAQVEIYDLNGRKVVSETMESSSATFMLQSQGAYLVKVICDGRVETKRIFIQR